MTKYMHGMHASQSHPELRHDSIKESFPAILSFDPLIMIAVAVACLSIFFTGFSIARWEGFLFLGSYIAYTVFLILVATNDPVLETFTNAMLLILPLITTTLIWTGVQALRRRN